MHPFKVSYLSTDDAFLFLIFTVLKIGAKMLTHTFSYTIDLDCVTLEAVAHCCLFEYRATTKPVRPFKSFSTNLAFRVWVHSALAVTLLKMRVQFHLGYDGRKLMTFTENRKPFSRKSRFYVLGPISRGPTFDARMFKFIGHRPVADKLMNKIRPAF
jgi:hypothetical protein